jgi:prepilin-type processing-associated H-X9-DG protein
MSPTGHPRTNVNEGDTPGRKGVIIWPGFGATRRLADIIDGTAKTILIAEKCIHPLQLGAEGGDNERWNNSGWDEDCLRWHFKPISDMDTPEFVPGTKNATAWRRFFGSAHPDGLNAVFVDGSVRFTSFSVDADVWRVNCVADDNSPGKTL